MLSLAACATGGTQLNSPAITNADSTDQVAVALITRSTSARWKRTRPIR